MEIMKFKTNVAAEEDVVKVASGLDQLPGISNWKLDPTDENHLLSLSGTNLDPQQVENAVQQAGFTAELVRVVGIGGEGL